MKENLEYFKNLGKKIGINWDTVKFTPNDLKAGFKIELEHGARDAQTDVTHNDPIKTAKIVLAHLKEKSNYYQLLKQVEESYSPSKKYMKNKIGNL